MPPPDLDEFIQACVDEAVFVWDVVLADSQYFGLYTDQEIMAFIANRGLGNPTLQNCKPLEHWNPPPPRPPAPLVYAYNFRSLDKRGYIAFFKNPITGIWTLKSMKMDDKAPEDFPAIPNKKAHDALQQLRERLIQGEKRQEGERE